MDYVNSLFGNAGPTAGSLIWALVILLAGWLVALIIRNVIYKLLLKTSLDDKLAKVYTDAGDAKPVDAAKIISRIVYYVLLLAVIVAFFDRLGLQAVTVPLNAFLSTIWGWLPGLLGAAVIFLIALVVATLVRFLLRTLFKAIKLDERFVQDAGVETEDGPSASNAIAEGAYWLIFLLFLPSFLGALGLRGLMEPVQGMVDDILGYLPNILAAAVIFLIGWVVARVIRRLIVNFLAAIGTDNLGKRWGLDTALGTQTLSSIIGLIVYTLIMLGVLISALDALAIKAISGPAVAMLQMILNAIPAIVGAIIVLVIAYFVAKLIADLVTNILTGLGFNRLLVWLKLGGEPGEGKMTPSQVVGYLVLVLIMLLSITGAAELLGFAGMSVYVSVVLAFVARILVALVVFAIGIYLANLARMAIQSIGGSKAQLLSQVAWIAIVFFSAMLALGQTGIGQDIVNLAFGLALGAVAVAAALAFGLGGREVAGRELDTFVTSFKEKNGE